MWMNLADSDQSSSKFWIAVHDPQGEERRSPVPKCRRRGVPEAKLEH